MEGFYVIFNRAEKTIQFAVSKCNVIDKSAVRSYIQGNISLSGNVIDKSSVRSYIQRNISLSGNVIDKSSVRSYI